LVQLYDLVKAGKINEAAALWPRLRPLSMLLWEEPFNPVAKAASNLSGRNVGECRRPVPPLNAEQMAKVKAACGAVRRTVRAA
jgi:4-hydroxy-tetrahydrodipicolinate synthase